MKKRVISLVILLLALAGCGGQTAAPSTAQASPSQAITAESSEVEKDAAKEMETETAGESTTASETGSTEAAAETEAAEAASKPGTGEDNRAVEEKNGEVENAMRLLIGEREVPVTWKENESVKALKELCPLTIQMSTYGGFEQVGPIGKNIVREDEETVTESGDIVLYSGNQIVIFYGSNSWAYTRLGHIDLSEQEMSDLLDSGDVTITLE